MPPTSAPTNAAQQLTFQGLVVPGSALNPEEFFRRTRRQTLLYKTISQWASFGNTDTVGILRSGVLSFITVKVAGTLTITPGAGGSVTPTQLWPLGLIRAARFQANGQSNLVNADGWFLRLREIMRKEALDDRGVSQAIFGTTYVQGTLKLASELWGPAPGTAVTSTTNYDIELTFRVPVAYEEKTLAGAIFLQTTSTTCELNLDWANVSDLFDFTAGAPNVTFTPTVSIEAEAFTIPKDGQGGFYLPNLSNFHTFIKTRFNGQISQGNNEITLSGQGVGRKLMSVAWRTWNNAPGALGQPIVPTANNITLPYWRYGTNETPEQWVDGQSLRYENERNYNSDIANPAGFEAIDFDKIFAFRDSVDEGSATEIRFGFTVTTNPTLTAPFMEYAQDVMLAGASA